MLLSIDICGGNVYTVEGTATQNSVEITRCSEAKLPEGTIDDGEIKNQTAFVMTLSKLLQADGAKLSSAVMTFTSGSVLSRRLKVPAGKPYEVSAMVKNQMSQTVGSPADFVFEYTYASKAAKDAPAEVWAYALDKDFIDKYYKAIKSLKLRPVALDIHSNCIEKLLAGSSVNGSPLSDRAALFVDIERDYIEIHLFSGNERVFSRISPVSASEFLLIANNLGYGRPTENLSLNEKKLLAMSPDGGLKKHLNEMSYDALDITPQTLESDAILADAAHQYTGRLDDELLKMTQFQMMRDSSKPVSCVYIYGTFSPVKGLDESLAQSLTCPVEVIKNISKVKISEKIRIAKYLNAVGALIRVK